MTHPRTDKFMSHQDPSNPLWPDVHLLRDSPKHSVRKVPECGGVFYVQAQDLDDFIHLTTKIEEVNCRACAQAYMVRVFLVQFKALLDIRHCAKQWLRILRWEIKQKFSDWVDSQDEEMFP